MSTCRPRKVKRNRQALSPGLRQLAPISVTESAICQCHNRAILPEHCCKFWIFNEATAGHRMSPGHKKCKINTHTGKQRPNIGKKENGK